MVEIGEGLQPVGLGRLDQAVDGGAGLGTPRGVGKEPVLASHREGPDGIFRQGIADVQSAIFKVADQ